MQSSPSNKEQYLEFIRHCQTILSAAEKQISKGGFNEFGDNDTVHLRCADGEVEIVVERFDRQFHWIFARHRGDAFARVKS